MIETHFIPKNGMYILSEIKIGDFLKDEKTGIIGQVIEITKHQNIKGYYYEFNILVRGVRISIRYNRTYK